MQHLASGILLRKFIRVWMFTCVGMNSLKICGIVYALCFMSYWWVKSHKCSVIVMGGRYRVPIDKTIHFLTMSTQWIRHHWSHNASAVCIYVQIIAISIFMRPWVYSVPTCTVSQITISFYCYGKSHIYQSLCTALQCDCFYFSV